MLHPHKKYDHIQDPTGMIPEDEPVFILRAGDQIAPMVVRYWADRNDHAGGDPAVSQAARDHADKMERWPKKNLADPTAGPEPQTEEQPAGEIVEAMNYDRQGDADVEQPAITDEQKSAIIKEHISHLPSNITARHQVIASAGIFIEDIKADLAVALDCQLDEVPEKLADYMGFTAAESEKRPGSGKV